jgi:rhodanese-related sulfurtransferase
MSITQLSVTSLQEKLQQDNKLRLLDVRERNEFEFAHIKGSQLIPLGEIADRIGELTKGEEYVVICHHGIRSQQAATYLDHAGFSPLYNLAGGIDAWSVSCDNSVLRY